MCGILVTTLDLFFLDIFFCRHKFYLSLKHIQSGQYRRYSSADVPMVRSRWQMAFNQTEFLSGHEVWSGSVLSATRPCVSVRAPSIFSFLYWKYDFCWQNCSKICVENEIQLVRRQRVFMSVVFYYTLMLISAQCRKFTGRDKIKKD